MKQRNMEKKFVLNKETIASLSQKLMNQLRAGSAETDTDASPSKIGVSCYTGHCCYSKIECD